EITKDPLLLRVLRSTSVREVALERLLTSIRASLLSEALNDAAKNDTLTFCCALAEQCFINEYVFDMTHAEIEQLDQLKASLDKEMEASAGPSPFMLAAIAMYEPLYKLPWAQGLLDKTWPPALAAVITQQVQEVFQERALRSQISRLTPVDDSVSQ